MRSLVLDASAAIAHLREEHGAGRVRSAIDEYDPLLVPALFWSEVVNSLAVRHSWPGSEVLSAIYDLEQLGIRTEPHSRQLFLAMIDAVEARGLSAYDAQYLVLAEAADAHLLTGDTRLLTAAGDRAIDIHGRDRVSESSASYEVSAVDWPTWPGARAYLETLRREVATELEAR